MDLLGFIKRLKAFFNYEFISEVGFTRWLCRTLTRRIYKQIKYSDHTITLPSGNLMRLPIRSKFASAIWVTNCNVDWGSEKLLYSLLKKAGCFLDIGANIGYYSVYMQPKVTAVYAFEPDPRAREYCRLNLENLVGVELIPMAVSNYNGSGSFIQEAESDESHLLNADSDSGARACPINVISVDEFVGERDIQVEAIKIDVEGFDWEVLLGAERTLRVQNPIVLTELKPTQIFYEFMDTLSYAVFAFVKGPGSSIARLQQLNAKTVAETKMLFLMPQSKVHLLGNTTLVWCPRNRVI
jgi:FkbM family methyltransferase